MHTMPERRPSSSPEEAEIGGRSVSRATAEAEKLTVVPKARVGPKESAFADQAFRGFVVLCAIAVMAVVGLIIFELIRESRPSMVKFGFKFLTKQIWDPVAEDFGALPFIYGTIVSSILALVIAVPLSIGTALFLTELCPLGLRGIPF